MMTLKSQNNIVKFTCKICNYNTSKKTDYNKHLMTLKHKFSDNDDK